MEPVQLTDTIENPEVLGEEKIIDLIRLLPVEDKIKLRMSANRFSGGILEDAEDLLQEAFARAISGDRKCPTDCPIVVFLIGVIRSIASSKRKSDKNKPEIKLVPKHGDSDASLDILVPDDAPSAERVVSAKNQVARIMELFDDDEVIQVIIEGRSEGMGVDEIKEVADISQKEYEAARKRMRRKINKYFPNGLEK